MPENIEIVGMGWLPDHPSIRDYSMTTTRDEISAKHVVRGGKAPAELLPLVKFDETALPDVLAPSSNVILPTSRDWRQWCSPIQYQGALSSCTAHAGVGLVEYCERKSFKGKYIRASRLFLYKVTRNLMHQTGDQGGLLRRTMEALTLFGTPPEEYWPYGVSDFDREPSAFCYSFAQNYQAITYYRLDDAGTSKTDLLRRIKAHLACGLPSMFGFTVFGSIVQAGTNHGKIPFPYRDVVSGQGEDVLGGHAVMAVGYDDEMEITNTGETTSFQVGGGQMGGGQMGGVDIGGGQMGGGQMGIPQLPPVHVPGALIIRNSWGTGWGEGGYGYLPYDYVLQGLAQDWWVLLKNEWVNTHQFEGV